MRELLVLVPKPDSIAALTIDRGSGIVCDPLTVMSGAVSGDEMIDVYYEGNRYGAINMRTFSERVKQAAGRLQQRYPTVAHGAFLRSEFAVVGTYRFENDWSSQELTITDGERLLEWLGGMYQ
jgi:hypothetical protein